ncbi:hypothetical protein [Azospirillum picis]|uniref:Lipoprotein n=1 Tax=Azospirillum picis TaxID=488438 RepID=A0ABU0MLJ1_9PROT|nr:hypothetical protein [Azospirillum picis]MBP2301041.1 hypothetical protein [Azospirillum picis]MDQ0534339.1 hypothetical protein [Azospirillum picis]
MGQQLRSLGGAAALFGGVAVILAGCATGQDADVARRAQTELVGLSKADLLSCAGVPDRQASASGREYYTYVARSSGAYSPGSSIGIGAGSFGSGSGVGLGLGFGVPIGGGSSYGCEATMVIGPNGRVEQVSYPNGAYLPSCSPIVTNCVTPRG